MFKDRLKELRTSKGISQYKLADELGVAQSTVGGWESGKREPNFKMTEKIANFFDVSTDYLLGKSEYESIERKKFESDFDIKIFDDIVIKYINNVKQQLKDLNPDIEINNTLVIQNIIIDMLADRNAKIKTGLIKTRLSPQFQNDGNNFITGKQLYNLLFTKYCNDYKEKRKEILKPSVEYIIEDRINLGFTDLDSREIEILKQFYEAVPNSEIPLSVQKVLLKYEIEKLDKEIEKLNEDGDPDSPPTKD